MNKELKTIVNNIIALSQRNRAYDLLEYIKIIEKPGALSRYELASVKQAVRNGIVETNRLNWS